MTKKISDISAADLKKLHAARGAHAEEEFQRIARENAFKTQLLAPFIPPVPANPRLADLDEKTRHLIKSVVEHVPERDRREGKPRGNFSPFFDDGWRDIQPPEAAVEWYGPNVETGRVGAKLISHAEGDRTAACLVCKFFTADRDGIMQAYAQAVVASGYEDTGGIGPSSARSKGALGIWIDQAPAGPYGLAYAESVIWDESQAQSNLDMNVTYIGAAIP